MAISPYSVVSPKGALQTVGTPEHMAQAAIWFLEGADLVTGEILMVDAGSHLGGGAPLKAR